MQKQTIETKNRYTLIDQLRTIDDKRNDRKKSKSRIQFVFA